MKLLLVPRPALDDFVMLFHASATENLPERLVRSKMAKLPPDSPARLTEDDDLKPRFYRGTDAEEIYDTAVISMGEEHVGPLEADYEGIREEYPDRGLRPYSDLSDAEKGSHYRSYVEMQKGFAELGEMIRAR